MDSLRDRLKALGVKVERPPDEAVAPKRNVPIEAVVAGSPYQTIYGDTFVTNTLFDRRYVHGTIDPFAVPDLDVMVEWSKLSYQSPIDHRRIVFLDTETSGLAGGVGTFAFLIGLGYYTDAGFQVVQLFMKDPSQEAALLAALSEHLSEFACVVTFNGKSFDLPLVNTRMTLNGLTSPVAALGHIDLLHLARRIWRDRLPSRALGELEKEIMGFFRDQEEVPGYLIPQYYYEYLKSGDATPLAGVLYHNAIDIMSLAALFAHTGNILSRPTAANIPSLDVAAIARLHEDLGRLESAAALYKQCLSDGMPEEFYIKTLERFASMRRKQGRPDLAATLWQEAAQRSHIPAYIELSKYHEHATRDLQAAIDWIDQAFGCLARASVPGYVRKLFLEDLEKRRKRLAGKLERRADNDQKDKG